MRLVVFHSEDPDAADQPWFLRLVADNGEALMVSEGHEHRVDVIEVATKIQRQSRSFSIETENGEPL